MTALFVRRLLRTVLRPHARLMLSGSWLGVRRSRRALAVIYLGVTLRVGRTSRSGVVFCHPSVAVVAAVLVCLLITALFAVTVHAMVAAGGAVGPLVTVAAGGSALVRSGPVCTLAACKLVGASRGGWATAAGARCVMAMMRPRAARMRTGVLLLGRLVSEWCTRPTVTMRIGTTCGEVGLRQPALRLLAVRL